MKLSDALEYEKLRENPENWGKMLMNHDGKFYHIYNWSAWILCAIMCTGVDAPKVQLYKGKEREYVMCGFPLGSIGKFIPEYESLEEKDGDLIIDLGQGAFDGKTFEKLNAAYEEWKNTLPIANTRKAKVHNDVTVGANQQTALARSGLFCIISEVMCYPLESSTPIQNVEFISSLKMKVASLL